MTRSTFLHLRIPFSFFLMPVFLFAWAISEKVSTLNFVLVFTSLHFFLYPASNGYNSYFDKDEGSIGGLENPPKVSKELYTTSLMFDIVGLVIGLLVGWQFAVLLLIYGLVSKAYSHPAIRLKKYPFISWLVIGVFQGAFTFLMVYIGLNAISIQVVSWEAIHPALLSSFLLLGSYPMTQIYQHKEDRERGDITISLLLGVKGTFILTGVLFGLATVGYLLYFQAIGSNELAITFLLSMLPTVLYFGYWFLKVLKSKEEANFKSTMRLNLVSALSLNLFFLYLGYILI